MLVLLLPYVAKSKGAAVDTLAVADLSAEVVRSFLAHLESERQCSTATRNQRLGSIHALARFIGAHNHAATARRSVMTFAIVAAEIRWLAR